MKKPHGWKNRDVELKGVPRDRLFFRELGPSATEMPIWGDQRTPRGCTAGSGWGYLPLGFLGFWLGRASSRKIGHLFGISGPIIRLRLQVGELLSQVSGEVRYPTRFRLQFGYDPRKFLKYGRHDHGPFFNYQREK